jgi:hypothetical protein
MAALDEPREAAAENAVVRAKRLKQLMVERGCDDER